MDPHEFWDKIHSDRRFEWLGSIEAERPIDDYVIVRNDAHPDNPRFTLTIQTILDNDWEQIEAVLEKRRLPRVLLQVTRIVGYYSFIHSWNRSKLAELADRQKGNYALAEPAQAAVA